MEDPVIETRVNVFHKVRGAAFENGSGDLRVTGSASANPKSALVEDRQADPRIDSRASAK